MENCVLCCVMSIRGWVYLCEWLSVSRYCCDVSWCLSLCIPLVAVCGANVGGV